MNNKTLHTALLLLYIAVLIWSVIRPFSLFLWFLEVAPALIGVIILMYTYPRFRFTNLTYVLLWISVILVAIGGHYTYEKVPLFNWLRDTFDLNRNHYDRFVHFFQGGITAIFMREFLIRKSPLTQGKLLIFIVLSIVLAFSSLYELVEFASAKISKQGAEAFMGMQGDIWDSQWDMLLNGLGAVVFLLLLAQYHNRLLARMEQKEEIKEAIL